jgi:hypothetical protein
MSVWRVEGSRYLGARISEVIAMTVEARQPWRSEQFMTRRRIMHRRDIFQLAAVAVLAGCLCTACDPGPPEVSQEAAALEQYLLTADEVGGGFTWQESGAVRGADVGHLCPGADVSFDDLEAMRAWFTKPSGADEVSVEQYLATDDSEALDALMLDLQTAFADCDGIKWDYFGEKMQLDEIEVPPVGDERVAVRQSGPTTDDVLETLRAYVREGEVLVIVEVEERRDSADSPQAVDKATFDEILTTAVSKLPD